MTVGYSFMGRAWPALVQTMPRLMPILVLGVFIVPVIAGLLGTILPAFGYQPVLGYDTPSMAPFQQMFTVPGLGTAVLLSLWTGIGSTIMALALAVLLVAGQPFQKARRRLARLLPWMSVPHVAVAFGLFFLLSPSGWFVRLIIAPITGAETPPAWVTVRDPYGISLLIGLGLKESIYLLLVMVAALARLEGDRQLSAARSWGYGPWEAWLKVVFPQLYTQIRLPLLVVLSYGVGNVDMALVLGPQTLPPLAVLVLRMLTHPDLTLQLPAAAGALLQVGVVGIAFGFWWVLERTSMIVCQGWLMAGPGQSARPAQGLGLSKILTGFMGALLLLILVVLVLWSMARGWFFPDVLPGRWTLDHWHKMGPTVLDVGGMTIGLALLVTVVGGVLTVSTLESHHARPSRLTRALLMVCYVPLMVPQIAFLYGFQVVLSAFGWVGSLLAVSWAHLIFVLPYMLLTLADPYGGLDPRYRRVAKSLGAGPMRRWLVVVVPLLRGPIMTACAVGFSVSVAQYLSTVFAGGGRFPTMTTEALALSSGGNRAIVGVLSVMLALIPLGGFSIFLWLGRDRLLPYRVERK